MYYIIYIYIYVYSCIQNQCDCMKLTSSTFFFIELDLIRFDPLQKYNTLTR